MTTDTKKCPYCAEEIKADAKKCRYCGEYLDETMAQEKSASQNTANNNANVNTVECAKCHNHVIPSVHLVDAPYLPKARYAVNQHICPNCGNLLFQNGGEWRLSFKIMLAVSTAIIILGLIIIWLTA